MGEAVPVTRAGVAALVGLTHLSLLAYRGILVFPARRVCGADDVRSVLLDMRRFSALTSVS